MRHPIALTALTLLQLAACTDPTQGTVVGNPGLTRLRVAPITNVRFDEAAVDVDAIRWQDCDGGEEPTSGATLDLTDQAASIEVPTGTWCGVELDVSRLELVGRTVDSDRSVQMELEPGTTFMGASAALGGFDTGETPVLIELAYPEWFVVAELVEGQDGWSIGPQDQAHGSVAARVSTASALFIDEDEDGILDDEERASPAASGPGRR